jgi:hypothetical protein
MKTFRRPMSSGWKRIMHCTVSISIGNRLSETSKRSGAIYILKRLTRRRGVLVVYSSVGSYDNWAPVSLMKDTVLHCRYFLLINKKLLASCIEFWGISCSRGTVYRRQCKHAWSISQKACKRSGSAAIASDPDFAHIFSIQTVFIYFFQNDSMKWIWTCAFLMSDVGWILFSVVWMKLLKMDEIVENGWNSIKLSLKFTFFIREAYLLSYLSD